MEAVCLQCSDVWGLQCSLCQATNLGTSAEQPSEQTASPDSQTVQSAVDRELDPPLRLHSLVLATIPLQQLC